MSLVDSFKNKSVRKKLIFITMLTTVVALLLASVVFLTYELVTFRYKIAENVFDLTEFVGNGCKKALREGDARAAQEVLASLINKESIRMGLLYDQNGKIMARYSDRGAESLGLLSEGLYHSEGHIHSYKRIKIDDNQIGTVYLQSDLSELGPRIWLYGRILIVVMLCIFLVSLQISSRLQEIISDPILHLVDVAHRISEQSDYSLRARKRSDDEVGQLTDAFNDMLKQIEKAEKQLQFEAFHDSLTSLPNRALLLDRLERMIERHKRNSNYKFAIMYLDLDRFKLVNDSLGHFQGDQLLKGISNRITRYLRKADTVARLGGDEFVILLDQIKNASNTALVAERLQERLSMPFDLNGQEVFVTASIGITTNKEGYEHPDEYLRDADNAMYKAKALGKARYQIFDVTMHNHAVKILELESDLRRATKQEDFFMHYQPIYDVKTKKIIRLEALLRWKRNGEMTAPLEFIPLAEETGLIVPIGRSIFEMVCHQLAVWKKEGHDRICVAINFSAKQLEQKDLVEFIQKNLTKSKIDASCIEIEITENVSMRDIDANIRLMKELRKLGVEISIDDFGMGYSSLNRLRSLPVQRIKIDRTFIRLLDKNKPDVAISEAIIKMAHSLDFKVVAEGVETEVQMDILKEIECDEVQGFLFAKPLPSEDVIKLIT